MPFILGTSLLGYDYVDDEGRSLILTVESPDVFLWDPDTPGDIEPGSGTPGGNEPIDLYVQVGVE